MHENALKKIRGKFTNALRNCAIDRSWPFFESYSKDVFDAAKEVIKHKKQWLTISSVFSIFNRKVRKAISDTFEERHDVAGKLQELLGNGQVNTLCDTIVQYITTIPRTYLIYFPLPGLGGIGQEIVELADALSFRRYEEEGNIPGGAKKNVLLTLFDQRKLMPEKTYVCVQEEGYVGSYSEDSAFLQATSKLKQLVHLGFSLKAFTERQRPTRGLGLFGGPLFPPALHAIVFDEEEPDNVCCSVLIPQDIAVHIDKVTLNVESSHYKQAHGKEKVVKYIQAIFKRPARLITSSSEHKYAVPVKTAIEWAFDSASNENETIAFLQICIGLEAILGDEADRESLTETLADRCAYLIGTDRESRKRIKDNFKQVYGLRSKLVHGRAVRLHHEEKGFLDWGRNILDYVIKKELENLNLENT